MPGLCSRRPPPSHRCLGSTPQRSPKPCKASLHGASTCLNSIWRAADVVSTVRCALKTASALRTPFRASAAPWPRRPRRRRSRRRLTAAAEAQQVRRRYAEQRANAAAAQQAAKEPQRLLEMAAAEADRQRCEAVRGAAQRGCRGTGRGGGAAAAARDSRGRGGEAAPGGPRRRRSRAAGHHGAAAAAGDGDGRGGETGARGPQCRRSATPNNSSSGGRQLTQRRGSCGAEVLKNGAPWPRPSTTQRSGGSG